MRRDEAERLVRNCINKINAAYGRKTTVIDTPEKAQAMVQVWTEFLQDLPRHKLVYAVNTWISTRSWPPAISEIRELALTSDLPEAEGEWKKVKKCFNDKARYDELHFITKDAIAMVGGLSSIGSADAMDARKQFIAAFNARKKEVKIRMMERKEDADLIRDAIEGDPYPMLKEREMR